MISPTAIESAIQPLLHNENLLISTLVCKISNQDDINNPNVVKVVFDKEHFALYFSRSPIPYIRDYKFQVSSFNLQLPYYKHQGLYVYRRDFLLTFTKWEQSNLEKLEKLEQLRAIENGVRIKVVETEYNSIGIDTLEDLEKALTLF
jgi:3-deoxy-manno-octulosonate cytidylyltransferase (CMP-KDO synthetase)